MKKAKKQKRKKGKKRKKKKAKKEKGKKEILPIKTTWEASIIFVPAALLLIFNKAIRIVASFLNAPISFVRFFIDLQGISDFRIYKSA